MENTRVSTRQLAPPLIGVHTGAAQVFSNTKSQISIEEAHKSIFLIQPPELDSFASDSYGFFMRRYFEKLNTAVGTVCAFMVYTTNSVQHIAKVV